MGAIRRHKPVLPFAGILTADPCLLPAVEALLAERFGTIAARSEIFPFDSTHYYDAEMGSPLVRQFVAFAELVEPRSLVEAKHTTNELEQLFASRGNAPRRPVNLDPGYVDEAKVILASTKDFSHRIPLADGIYAEVTLHWEAKEWRAFPWTFPDFRTGRYSPFFNELRSRYRSLSGRSRP